MVAQGSNCPYCGAPVPPGATNCVECGRPLIAQVNASESVSATSSSSGRNCLIIAAVVVALLVCCGVIAAIGAFFYFRADGTEMFSSPSEEWESAPVVERRITELTDTTLFDDFSTRDLEWYEDSDEISSLGYENDAYFIQITEPDYIVWSYFPGDFNPKQIAFDVMGQSAAEQQGTVGVFCQLQDDYNYNFLEIDLEARMYRFAQAIDDETSELSDGWLDLDALTASPEEVNHILLTCTLDSMALEVNGQSVGSASVTAPFESEGPAALFIWTESEVAPSGFRTNFDNVAAWAEPQ